jgi:hypothetical protein
MKGVREGGVGGVRGLRAEKDVRREQRCGEELPW